MNIDTSRRQVAVQLASESMKGNAMSALDALMQPEVGAQVTLFKPEQMEVLVPCNVEVVDVPDETAKHAAKFKNLVLGHYRDAGFKGFLHIIEDCIHFLKCPADYMDKLEKTMQALDYDMHLSTAADPCNYIFKKFCPRLTVNIDDEQLASKFSLPSKLMFTSNSNTSYITCNYAHYDERLMKLDERFTIGMFVIIELLARRRALRAEGQLYYMNQYLAIGEETSTYRALQSGEKDGPSRETMQKEDMLFRTLDIDYTPDNNLDVVLDALYTKLKS